MASHANNSALSRAPSTHSMDLRASQLSIASLASSYDANPDPPPSVFDSEELCAIFGRGLVLEEARTGLPSVRPIVQASNPQTFKNTLADNIDRVQSEFSSQTTRAEFFEQQVKAAGTFVTAVNQLDLTKAVSIVDVINTKMMSKKKPTPIMLCGKKILLPHIDSQNIQEVSSGIDVYSSSLLDCLDTIELLQHRRIDRDMTMVNIRQAVKARSSDITNVAPRKEVNIKIVSAIVLERALYQRQQAAISLLNTRPLINDTFTTGAFVRIDDSSSTIKTRSESMIAPSAIATDVVIHYNFNHRQLHQLVTYMLSSSVSKRMEAKVNLLSSVKDHVRSDLVTKPLVVFRHAIGEHYLTREELLHVVFPPDTQDRSVSIPPSRCLHCGQIANIAGTVTRHPPNCHVIQWLIDHFQFKHADFGTVAPTLTYLAPSVAEYSQQLIELDAHMKGIPYVSRSEHDHSIYTLDHQGIPRKVTHTGSKPVRPLGTSYNV